MFCFFGEARGRDEESGALMIAEIGIKAFF
jgi:hypothetical protein